MPKVTVDGVEVTVDPGTNLIEAAYKAGKVIPHFCYHTKLSIAGNCRMCLVEIEGARKPEVACNTVARDGMVVHTDSEKVRKLRRGVLEFLFLNHPLDCPICDKAGECKLQDYYVEHGQYVSRLDEGKVRKPKRLDIGDHIILDTERCVLCSRCVRFCDEITKTGELRIFERGAHANVGIYPTQRLNNRYSICTTDICPVGALTCKEFRFKSRVWYLEQTQSICGGCANGCNIEAHHSKGEVRRFMPRRNDGVNDTWMCDDGRLSFAALQGENRLLSSLERRQGSCVEISLEDALARVGSALEKVRAQQDGKALGFVLSPQASLEENFLLAQIAKQLEARVFLVAGNPVGSPRDDDDGFLIRADKNPNTRGAGIVADYAGAENPKALLDAVDAGELEALICLRNDIVGKAREAGTTASFERLSLLVALDSSANATTELAHVTLPLATYLETDGTWVNFAGRIQKFHRAVNPKGSAMGGWELLPRLADVCGLEVETLSAQGVFSSMGKVIEVFAGKSYETIGELGVVVPGLEAAEAEDGQPGAD